MTNEEKRKNDEEGVSSYLLLLYQYRKQTCLSDVPEV